MPWPASRLTTYTPASPVKSNDLNAIQDATIAGQHGDWTECFPTSRANGGWTWSTANMYWLSSIAADQFLDVPMKVGDRLKSFSFWLYGDGAADVTVTVYKFSSAMVATSIGSLVVTNQAAAWAEKIIDVTDTTLAAGESVGVVFAASATGLRLGTASKTYDHP
jgi:hypothetical protein